MNKQPWTTSDIPREYWKDACLVGEVPFKASSQDQRASYCMYVPETHYQVNETRIPLIVTIHGNGRDASKSRDMLVDFADRTGAAVLAPLFPAGIDDPNDQQNYKLLNYQGIRYDLLLLDIVEEVAVRWPGIATGKFFLMGFSGGGQFCLKFFYLHPSKLEAVSIGAPGVVTRLDGSVPWPWGTKDVEKDFDGLTVDLDAMRKIDGIQLIVGGDDVEKVAGGLLEWALAKRKDVPELYRGFVSKLPNRKEALTALQKEFEDADIKSEFVVVDGVAHDSKGVFSRVAEFLEPHLVRWHSTRSE